MKYCHPIQIRFKKEIADTANEETSVIEERIKQLEKMVITLEEQNSAVLVSHKILLRMIVGKICNAVIEDVFCSTLLCMWCCTKTDETVIRDAAITNYRFRLPTLQMWIRFHTVWE
jgi:hypothetical protein